jgi:ADP-heptose:LPS heptosyltransferase
MIFHLSTAHLGDVLMAMPAMRAGDAVIARPQHRIPGLGVTWLDAGEGTYPAPYRGGHNTEQWLESTGRAPVRHTLTAAEERTLTVIAPDVAAPAKQWSRWDDLRAALPLAVVATPALTREAWMALLNRAHTVICPDTGTAHMADALGCPRVVALHGVPANWPRCAPYWNRAHCIARESMDAITVDDVLEVVGA